MVVGEGLCRHCGFALNFNPKKNAGPLFCCYGCVFAYQIISGASGDGKHISWVLVQLGFAAFLAMNVMGFSLAMHASSVYADYYARLSAGGLVYDQLLRYMLLMMSAPVLFMVGTPLFENVVSEARAGRWGVEGFISASVLAAFMTSMVSTFRGSGPIYYDIAVMVLVFLTLGRYLESRFRSKASKALEGLLEDQVLTAHLVDGAGEGRETLVAAEALNPKDEIALRAGDRIPADGQVLSGAAVVDMAPMTGESIPVNKKPGDTVWSGAFVTEGFLRVLVTHLSRESWLARLRGTLESARASKSSVQMLASKIVAVVTVLTVVAAAAAFYLGASSQGVMAGFLRALSVLVIVCPCALGAAIPLALWRSFERIAGNGILFKDLGLLETLSKVRSVFFDKTGTLTDVLPEIFGIENYSVYSDEEVLNIAACLAQVSMHPFSRSIRAAALAKGARISMPDEIYTEAGKGLRGFVKPYGSVVIGNEGFLERSGVVMRFAPDIRQTDSAQIIGSVLVAIDGSAACRVHFKERIRPEAEKAVRDLKAAGYHVGVITGDISGAAGQVGHALGIDVVSGLTPEGKLRWIKKWESEHGPSLVIGDGLNDAPTLAGASVSLAMGGALASAHDAADFSLPDDDLGRVPWLLRRSRRTFDKIRVNLFWAFFYNGLAVPLAVAGWVNPIVASMAMIVSSVCIILHSLSNER